MIGPLKFSEKKIHSKGCFGKFIKLTILFFLTIWLGPRGSGGCSPPGFRAASYAIGELSPHNWISVNILQKQG
ncbi:hypothetical protein [Circoviridae sp.]|nr:hypothetical protein [Circoviridae sp.]UOF81919.1 hypothetical protein [Circoviridae sp.]